VNFAAVLVRRSLFSLFQRRQNSEKYRRKQQAARRAEWLLSISHFPEIRARDAVHCKVVSVWGKVRMRKRVLPGPGGLREDVGSGFDARN
jgi:hypothetical protein